MYICHLVSTLLLIICLSYRHNYGNTLRISGNPPAGGKKRFQKTIAQANKLEPADDWN